MIVAIEDFIWDREANLLMLDERHARDSKVSRTVASGAPIYIKGRRETIKFICQKTIKLTNNEWRVIYQDRDERFAAEFFIVY